MKRYLTWQKAFNECSSIYGARLPEIGSAAENYAIYNIHVSSSVRVQLIHNWGIV